jgi:hypothetical protein
MVRVQFSVMIPEALKNVSFSLTVWVPQASYYMPFVGGNQIVCPISQTQNR